MDGWQRGYPSMILVLGSVVSLEARGGDMDTR